MWLATFFGCLLVSIDVGLALGVVLGVLILFKQVAFPDMARLGRIPGSTMYRHAGMYKLQVRSPCRCSCLATVLILHECGQVCENVPGFHTRGSTCQPVLLRSGAVLGRFNDVMLLRDEHCVDISTWHCS